MRSSDRTEQLLTEIRDLLQAYLEEYRRVTERAVDLQRTAVERQEKFGTLYRRSIAIGTAVVVMIVALLIYLLTLLP